MPLPVLVAVVAGGIALVVLLVHVTGGSRMALIEGEEQARVRFAIDYPEAETSRCFLSADRRIAILELADGHVGLVQAIGSNYLTRFVTRGEMAARVGNAGTGVVTLLTHDLTWPRAHMIFEDNETAREVAGLFSSELTGPAQEQAA
ncbi:hypothetical protein [Oricola sp.]|uniref:hypothetical protein n=1 Tax=Oricola sp. TaxID=1979950 RepID=UPI0035165833